MSRPKTPENTTSLTEDPAKSDMTSIGEKTDDNAVKQDQSKAGKPDEKLWTLQLVLVLVAIFLSLFLVAVDRTIISTVRVHSTGQS